MLLQTIIDAINNRQVLSLTYKGITRIVEPHAVGQSTAGHDVLSCYQVQGLHRVSGHDWDLLTVSKISGLSTTGNSFVGKDPRSTQRYSHLAIDTLTVAVGKIGRKSA